MSYNLTNNSDMGEYRAYMTHELTCPPRAGVTEFKAFTLYDSASTWLRTQPCSKLAL